VLEARRRERAFGPPSRFPASAVDLAFVVDEAVPAGAVQRTLSEAVGPVLEEIRVFDVFRAPALGDGKKSLAFNLRFRAPDHTLTDQEVGALRRRAIDAVTRAHGAVLRG
jgi:phenylalanyl-tRNA synthetase beta chain